MFKVDVWISGYVVVETLEGRIFAGCVKSIDTHLRLQCEYGPAAIPWDSISDIHCA